MTEREICLSYKGAKQPNEQARILAELNCTDRLEIIRILTKNEVVLACSTIQYLYRRLDQLDRMISKKEKKRRETMWDNHCKEPTKLNREIKEWESEYHKIAEILNMVKA